MSNILSAILLLLFVAIIWVGILEVIIWIISKTLLPLFKWVLKQEKVKKQISKARQFILNCLERYKKQITQLWEFITDIVIDPLFYGFVLFTFSNRVESIINYTKTNPQFNFWQLLNYDMENDMSFYWWFIGIFTIWMIGKAWKHREQVKKEKAILEILGSIERKLGGKDGKSETEHFDSVL